MSHNYATKKPLLELLADIILARFDTHSGPCTTSLWPNIVCALSNWLLTGVFAIATNWSNPYRRFLVLGAVLSSTIYHLAEIKSRLPGLPYLRRYAFALIQVDRAFAIAAMVEVLRMWFTVGVNWAALAIGVAGLACGILSERQVGWKFVFWHSLWHNAAFLTLALV